MEKLCGVVTFDLGNLGLNPGLVMKFTLGKSHEEKVR